MALFDDAMFAPQTYQGSGGLLGTLIAMLQANPQPGGFPALRPQQEPDPAQLPVNAQRTQGVLPQQYPSMPEPSVQQQPMQGMGQGAPQMSPRSLLPQMGGGGFMDMLMPGRMKAIADARLPQQAEQMFVGQGMNPALARIVANNPTLLAGVVGSQVGIKDRTEDIKEFEYAKAQGFKGTLTDWMAVKRGGAGEYGLQPIWGIGADGKPAVMQLGKSGTAIQSKMPDGFSIQNKPIEVPTGTGTVLLDPQTRQQIGFIPKELRQAEREKAIGEAEGKAAPGVYAAETTVNNAIATIGKLRSHPGLDLGTGGTGKIARLIPGTAAYDFDALNKQASGQAFMGAREALKGAGQVTDFEGAKGEQAIANLDAAQSKKAYLEALDTLERMMKQSLTDLKKKAGILSPPGAQGGGRMKPGQTTTINGVIIKRLD